jgi:hypothetical protein
LADPGRAKGKRGGSRLIYLYLPGQSRIHLLLIYGKDEQDDLTRDQRRQLRDLAEKIKQAARSN